MILVRDILQVKWNEMDKVLAGMRMSAENSPETTSNRRVLTDISGKYFTLVVETKAESVEAYWEAMQASFQADSQSEAASLMSGLIESGRREFFNIEFEGDNF